MESSLADIPYELIERSLLVSSRYQRGYKITWKDLRDYVVGIWGEDSYAVRLFDQLLQGELVMEEETYFDAFLAAAPDVEPKVVIQRLYWFSGIPIVRLLETGFTYVDGYGREYTMSFDDGMILIEQYPEAKATLYPYVICTPRLQEYRHEYRQGTDRESA